MIETRRLPVGSFVRLAKQDVQAIVDRLKALGYRTIGPQVADGAVIYDDLESVAQLPIGLIDQQDGGCYRLERSEEEAYFDYVVGPHSLKRYLFPPRETVLQLSRRDGQWQLETPRREMQPLAVIGPRACDLHGLRVLDRVFLEGPYAEPTYGSRRSSLCLIAVNCRRAAATCFCHSLKTGPALGEGFDLGLTELTDYFVVEVGTELGGEVIVAARWTPCSLDDIQTARNLPTKLAAEMRKRAARVATQGDESPRGRSLDTRDLHDLLLNNLEHPRWEDVAHRCLACGNCTLVCPTCFCSSVDDVSDLAGEHVGRERQWTSCFTADHSYMNSGTVRRTILSRYRQWLTHKLASWHDQFATSGCVGCGRCITWCPVGIDLTEEVASIRGEA